MKFINELIKLNLPSDQFAVFGSGPLGIRDLREVRDLDVIVKPNLWQSLAAKYHVKQNLRESICIGNIEIFKDWLPLFSDVSELIDTADILDGIRFVKLEYVLKWKKVFNREKDKKDIELVNKYIKSLN